MTENSPKRQLLESVIDAEKENYSEACETWRDIERKAQGTISGCGIILAATFGFSRLVPMNPSDYPDYSCWIFAPTAIKLAISIAVAASLLSLLFSLHALLAKRIEKPPFCNVYKELVFDAIDNMETSDPETMNCLQYDMIKLWSSANASTSNANEIKSRSLFLSQSILAIGVFSLAAIPLISMWAE